jgi:hypothetical protein
MSSVVLRVKGRACMDMSFKSYGKKERLPVVQFIHEGRRSNADAHCLARGSVSRDLGRNVWFETPPEGVCNFCDVI